MNRTEFRAKFGAHGPVVLPVIHVLETERTLKNISVLQGQGCRGCFLINHDFGVPAFLEILKDVRAALPDFWIGVNFLAVTGRNAFPQLAALEQAGCRVDAYWADDARIDERAEQQPEAQAIQDARGDWGGLYFGGTAFKKQRNVEKADYAKAAGIACDWMDVVTTSGLATGVEADDSKIATFRAAIGDKPLALASGISPENAHRYRDVDCFMVATGINFPDNFYDIDPERLKRLMAVTKTLGT